MPSKFILHSQPWISNKVIRKVNECLKTREISYGNLSAELASRISSTILKKHTILTGNGSAGLYIILTALKIGTGDEVVLPSYVCDSVMHAVRFTGATPILCDIGDSWVMEYSNVKQVVTSQTKAIVLVHLLGINAWDDAYRSFKVPIIEDVCQAFGTQNSTRGPGTYTQFAFGSFHGTKCIGAGLGGFASFGDEEIFDEAFNRRSVWKILGTMSDIHSAIALSILEDYDQVLEKRSNIAKKYFDFLPEKATERLKKCSTRSMFFRFPIWSDIGWDKVSTLFESNKIAARRGVDALIHRNLGFSDNNFPKSVEAFDKTVSIPILPQMSEQDVERVCIIASRIYDL